MVATHDRELVDLLQGLYAAHHFTDSLGSNGLAFDYKLHPGPATTRNAIALLGQRGAPAEVVWRALDRAEKLDRVRQAAHINALQEAVSIRTRRP
jgi:DNA mismatch repair ATPase MutS